MKLLALALTTALFSFACGDDDDGGDDGGLGVDASADIDAAGGTALPGKRSDVAGVADPASGSFALFGGDDGPIVDQIPSPAYLDDTWVYTPGAGWSEVTSAGPSARGRHTVAHDPNAGRMLAFGGRYRAAGTSGPYTLYDDLWSFDFADRTWTELDDGAGTAPSARYFAASAYDADSDTFYVYGGGTNSAPLDLTIAQDLWAFDSDGWRAVSLSGDAPSLRLFVGYTYDSTRNRLVIFGGQIGDFVSAALNDLYAIDLATGAWSQLHDGSGTAPIGRFSSMMTYDATGDRYLLFGGHGDAGVLNDLWAFDPTAGTWAQVRGADSFTGGGLGCLGNPREIPKTYVDEDVSAPERRSGGVFVALEGDLWLFGGESDCSDHLDDLWRYELTADWSEQIEATSGESCLRRNQDCACLCL